MILEYGFQNFFSFKEMSVISFKFDSNVPDTISKGKEASSLIGIKGGNASGKTNIIKVLSFLKGFAVASSDMKPDDQIPMRCFFNNEHSPSEFYIDFKIGHTYYKYELEITEGKVSLEKISKKIKKMQAIIERVNDEITYARKDFTHLKDIKLNSNASLISTFSKFKTFTELDDLNDVFIFFKSIMSNVNSSAGLISNNIDYRTISKLYKENEEIFDFAKDLIKKSDVGVSNITISEDTDEKGNVYFYPIFHHTHEENIFSLKYIDESSGTKQLYNYLALYWVVLEEGGILALDEFDVHLHSLLLPGILEMFENEVNSQHGAQFIFTSHNTEIIDTLGKYRTVLVNKEENESYCYRLDEIPGSIIRNDRPISPIYIKGKIGGVPRI